MTVTINRGSKNLATIFINNREELEKYIGNIEGYNCEPPSEVWETFYNALKKALKNEDYFISEKLFELAFKCANSRENTILKVNL